jgi:hypothetical protein
MKWLSLLMHYFPAVLQGVIAVEQAVGSSQPGATKKQVVMGAITAAAKVGGQVDEQHVAAISTLIDTTVGALNQAGVFGKPAAPAASAAASGQ